VRGGAVTRTMRNALRVQVGHYGGINMATITDNRGAQVVVKD